MVPVPCCSPARPFRPPVHRVFHAFVCTGRGPGAGVCSIPLSLPSSSYRPRGIRTPNAAGVLGGVDWPMESASATDLVGRADTLDELCSAVAGGGAGAIILGGPGVGKTALLKAAAVRLQDAFHIIPVRGTALAAATPYGALAYLVSELPPSAVDNPLQLLRELGRYLAAAAGGRRILLTVDNADLLDRYSSMVLSQLLRRGSIAVLAAASRRWEAGDELLDLWSEGLLRRVDLDPLSEQQTRQVMQQMLGGAVSSLAAGTMWREAAGSPRIIRLMTAAQLQAGTLECRNASWVRTAPYVRTGEVSEVVDTVLDRLDPDERRLVEMLALCRGLPLQTVLDLVPGAAVDALEEHQVIEVDSSAARVVLAAGTAGTVVAESMAPGRRRQLWDDVSVRIDPLALDPEDLCAFVAWTLECGEDPGSRELLQAARTANGKADAVTALRFVSAAPEHARSQELVLEQIRALHILGDLEEALRVFRALEPDLDPADRRSYVLLTLLHAQALAAVPGAGDPGPVLAALEAELGVDPDGAASGLAAEAVVVRSMLAVDNGRPQDVPPGLAALAGDEGSDPVLRAKALALQAHALALAGEGSAALEAITRLKPLLGSPLDAGTADEVCSRVFDTFILTGELERAAEFVAQYNGAAIRPSYQGSAGELAAALLAAWRGEITAAATALIGGLGQLRVHDPHDMLPLARSVCAYVHREQGNAAEAGQLLVEAGNSRLSAPHFRRVQARYFAILADGAAPEARCARLRAEAAREHEAGSNGTALLFLSAAVRMGDSKAAQETAELTAGRQGPFAALLDDYTAGLAEGSPAALLAAAGGFLELGQHQLCREAARAAGGVLDGTTEAAGQIRTARGLLNASLRKMKHVGGRAETLAELSEFEADLAHRAVTMATTTQIARELSLSPRTVEWHLGKIFAKLHVSGRAELAEVLA